MRDVMGFLEEAGVDFDVLEHAHTERAADEAAALGIRPEEVAKTSCAKQPTGSMRASVARKPASSKARSDTHSTPQMQPSD